jgi:tetratricopeptide (TPR) repeat protein
MNPMKPAVFPLLWLMLVLAPGGAMQQQKGPPPKHVGSAATPSEPETPPAAYDPLHAEESVEIGTFYMHKGDLAAAADRFRYAIKLKPDFAEPRLLLAKVSEKQGDKAGAIRYYTEYLKILPHAADAKKIRKRIEKLTRELNKDSTASGANSGEPS